MRNIFGSTGFSLLICGLFFCGMPATAMAQDGSDWRAGAGVAALIDQPEGTGAESGPDEISEEAETASGRTEEDPAEDGTVPGETETASEVLGEDGQNGSDAGTGRDQETEEGGPSEDSRSSREEETAAEHAGGETGPESAGEQSGVRGSGDAPEDSLGSDLVMANVKNMLNVRREPGTDAELVGYLYADCGGMVLERRDGWTKLQSGELTGWASDEYLFFGEDAKQAARDAGRMVAVTTAGALRIRKAPSLDAGVYDLLEEGAEYEVVDGAQLAFSDGMEISDEWVALDYEGKTGFVSADYVRVSFELDYGETLEQIRARQEAEKREKEEKTASRKRAIEKVQSMDVSDVTLLAALIQCEAGSDIYEGQVAVGAVVMNRVLSGAYPNTVRDVIFASGQFTPAGSGKLGRVLESGNINASCIQAAQEAMAGVSPVGSATRFRRAGNRDGIVVGHHVFW